MSDPLTKYGVSYMYYEKTFEEQINEVVLYAGRAAESQRGALVALRDRADAADGNAETQSNIVAEFIDMLRNISLVGIDREFEPTFNLLLDLLVSYVPVSDKRFDSLVDILINVAANPPAKGSFPDNVPLPSWTCRYTTLANLYNVLPAVNEGDDGAHLHMQVIEALLTSAISNDNLAVVAPVLDQLPLWIKEWALPVEKSDKFVYHLAVDILRPKYPRASYLLLIAYFEANLLSNKTSEASSSSSSSSSDLSDALAQVTLQVAPIPDLSRLSLIFDQFPIKNEQLASAYAAFVATNLDKLETSQIADQLKNLNIDQETLVKQTKLAKLAQLFASQTGHAVSYSDIANAVGVTAPQDDQDDDNIALVESWAIDAINAGLVTGRLSQVSLEFFVYTATKPTFEKDEWKQLETSLTQWRARLDDIASNVDSTLASASSS